MDAARNVRECEYAEQESSIAYWRARVDCLQEIVCVLLVKNETIRAAALPAAALRAAALPAAALKEQGGVRAG